MSASTAAREDSRKDGELVSYSIGAVKINKGTFVSLRAADGYVYPSRSGTSTDIFVGVAYETVDNSGGSAGATTIRVWKRGTFNFAKASAVQTDLVSPMYAADDQTMTATSTNNQLVGYPVGLVDSATLKVRIDLAAK
jgi:hypothetical protein